MILKITSLENFIVVTIKYTIQIISLNISSNGELNI